MPRLPRLMIAASLALGNGHAQAKSFSARCISMTPAGMELLVSPECVQEMRTNTAARKEMAGTISRLAQEHEDEQNRMRQQAAIRKRSSEKNLRRLHGMAEMEIPKPPPPAYYGRH